MDIAMPLLNGLEATRQILHAATGIKVLMLSAHSDDTYVEQAVAFGAKGFLLKQTSSNDLSSAIRELEKGNTYFSSSIARRRQRQEKKMLSRNGQRKEKVVQLTSREIEVLQLICRRGCKQAGCG
jgi:DNA-binding NarL/FixJ family response regulator